jgi:hypothetical protein
MRRSAYQRGQPSATGQGALSSGRLAMNPGHGAPNALEPAACRRARSRPNAAAAAGVAGPGGSQLRTRAWSSQPRTSGTGTAPAADSQFRPRASASTGLLGPAGVVGLLGWVGLLSSVGLLGPVGVVSLAKTSRPSVRVAR